MDRSRRNLMVGLSGVAAAAAGGWLLRDADDMAPPVRSLGPTDPQRPDVTEHGATGDGVTDDTGAIEAAIATALGETGSLRGGSIVFPRGVYRISRTLTIEQAAAVVAGAGRGTVLAWDGPPGEPMLRLDYCQGTSISGLTFVGKATAMPSAAVSVRTLDSHPNGCNFNTLSSIWIGGAGARQFDTGILFEGDDVEAVGNRFEMVSIVGCATGVRITQRSYRRNAFSGLRIDECDVGFESNAGTSNSGANWVLTGSSLTDIALGPGARLRVKGFASRQSSRLAMTESASLMVRDGSWEMGPKMASDGVVIAGRDGRGRSFLRLEDLDFTNNGARVPGRIEWKPPTQVFLHNFAGPPNTP
ncbi:MAG: glycosyl hydrolase family 28-related protein [Acidimicrobiales bacterium]